MLPLPSTLPLPFTLYVYLCVYGNYINTATAQTNSSRGIISDVANSNLWNAITGGVDAMSSCYNQEVHIDPYLGAFKLDPEVYCNGTGRNRPGITCCTPQTPQDIQMRFTYFNPMTPSKFREIKFYDKNVKNLLTSNTASKIKQSDKVVFLVHGFLETTRTSPWINGSRIGWLGRGAHVIIVDWSHGNQISYWQSAANVRSVGKALGYAIVNWNIANRTLIVGFSMGGQIAGEAGKYVKSKNQLIAECHALDAAGPYFDGGSDEVNLDKSDCGIVQALHTSAGHSIQSSIVELSTMKIGTSKKIGHCDYWINCGHEQKEECFEMNLDNLITALDEATADHDDGPMFQYLTKKVICSHIRSGLVYVSAVQNKCNYVTTVCKNCHIGGDDSCEADFSVPFNSMPPDALCQSDFDVDYLIMTEKSANYCNSRTQVDDDEDS